MWLINSPIGRKVVMSVTGICLILFLTFHACMNVVALFSGKAYNMICELLGANCRSGNIGFGFPGCVSHCVRFLADDAEPQGSWKRALCCN